MPPRSPCRPPRPPIRFRCVRVHGRGRATGGACRADAGPSMHARPRRAGHRGRPPAVPPAVRPSSGARPGGYRLGPAQGRRRRRRRTEPTSFRRRPLPSRRYWRWIRSARARRDLGRRAAGACGHPNPALATRHRRCRSPSSHRRWNPPPRSAGRSPYWKPPNPDRRSSSLPSSGEGRRRCSPSGRDRSRRNARWGVGSGRAGRAASPRRLDARPWGRRPPDRAALRCARGKPRSRRALPAAALRVRSRGRRGRRLASPYLAGSSRPHGRNPAGKPGTKDTGRRWCRTASEAGSLGRGKTAFTLD